jgi:hypothetical protein
MPQSRGDGCVDPTGASGAAGRRAGRARRRPGCPGCRAGSWQVHHLRRTFRPGRHAHRHGRSGAGPGRPGPLPQPPGRADRRPGRARRADLVRTRVGRLGQGIPTGPQPRHARRRVRLPAAVPPGARLPRRPATRGDHASADPHRVSGGRARRAWPGAVPKAVLRSELLGQLHRQQVPGALAPAPCARDRGDGPLVHHGCRDRAGGRLRLAAAAGLRAGSPHAAASRPASSPACGRRHRAHGRVAANAAGRSVRPGLQCDLRHWMRRGHLARRGAGVGGGPHPGPAPCRRPDHDQPWPGAPARVPAGRPRPGGRGSGAPDRLLAARLRTLRGRRRSAGRRARRRTGAGGHRAGS